jgi:hypothetical protein
MTEIGKALRQIPGWWSQASAVAESVDYTDLDMKSDAFYYCPV